MSNVFYLKNNAIKGKTGKTLAARFLSYDGRYIRDPNVEKARNAVIYTDAGGHSLADDANPDAYFIVPSDYSIQSAIVFSNMISDTLVCNGINSAYGLMIGAFMPNGSHDLQRTYPESDGTNPGCFVSEFTDSASFHFGFVATYSGIGERAALIGGGLLNRSHYLTNRRIDTSGIDGNNPDNVRSIQAGATFAQALQQRYGMHSPGFCYGLPVY
ncbi:hypothetical protein [Paraburkholderia sp. 22B1P]|uniref:hypothetical protein n=1 Tax=Paraburkholderia sp. 22B1P TaxID=3080498 RepID=UPI0030917D36|nr:hypothetical protein PBP221_42670 [Paraburkholderia sp. 22B1P]